MFSLSSMFTISTTLRRSNNVEGAERKFRVALKVRFRPRKAARVQQAGFSGCPNFLSCLLRLKAHLCGNFRLH
jgi:hypothetical protein